METSTIVLLVSVLIVVVVAILVGLNFAGIVDVFWSTKGTTTHVPETTTPIVLEAPTVPVIVTNPPPTVPDAPTVPTVPVVPITTPVPEPPATAVIPTPVAIAEPQLAPCYQGDVTINWGHQAKDAEWACNNWKSTCGNKGGCTATGTGIITDNKSTWKCNLKSDCSA